LIDLEGENVKNRIVDIISHQIQIRGDRFQKLEVKCPAATQRHRIVCLAQSKSLVPYDIKLGQVLESTIDASISWVAITEILLCE
jgi:hypothetical protein